VPLKDFEVVAQETWQALVSFNNDVVFCWDNGDSTNETMDVASI
jgi:hypothetical protein